MFWLSITEFLRPPPPNTITTGLGTFGAFIMAQVIAMGIAAVLWGLSRPLPNRAPLRILARVPGWWSILSPASIPALIGVLNLAI